MNRLLLLLRRLSVLQQRQLMKKINIIILIAMSSLVLSCLYSHTGVIGLEPHAKIIDAVSYTVLGESEGQSSSFNLLWIIPVTPRILYEKAVDDAVSKLGGDNLIDVRTWQERQIWIVGMVEILHVRGKVIRYEK